MEAQTHKVMIGFVYVRMEEKIWINVRPSSDQGRFNIKRSGDGATALAQQLKRTKEVSPREWL